MCNSVNIFSNLYIQRYTVSYSTYVHRSSVGVYQGGIKHTENKRLDRLCKLCNPLFNEFRVILSANAQSTYRVEMKYRECISPLSWSVHCKFVRDDNRKKGGGSPPLTLTSQGWFFYHDGMYARNRQMPLCVYSVSQCVPTRLIYCYYNHQGGCKLEGWPWLLT